MGSILGVACDFRREIYQGSHLQCIIILFLSKLKNQEISISGFRPRLLSHGFSVYYLLNYSSK